MSILYSRANHVTFLSSSSIGRAHRVLGHSGFFCCPRLQGVREFKTLRRQSIICNMAPATEAPGDVIATARITLTPQESKLRSLLLDVARYIDESKEIKEQLELRFAGGWVRDKLLNIPSHDIDTAINVMTGYAFSLKMKEYLDVPENRLKHGIESVSNLHKIAANPEKSKHLETVTTKILGYDVDFVNLRKETYSVDSRHPQMEFGTAKEDALRRDATVNALFYNIHTDKVEDFAGGLADLHARLIRTPLAPHQTFIDDPLRVLRLIRFASRLGFTIDPESEVSVCDATILEALKLKISRERIGTEIEKMLSGQYCSSTNHTAHSILRAYYIQAMIPAEPLNLSIGWGCTRLYLLIQPSLRCPRLISAVGIMRMTAWTL